MKKSSRFILQGVRKRAVCMAVAASVTICVSGCRSLSGSEGFWHNSAEEETFSGEEESGHGGQDGPGQAEQDETGRRTDGTGQAGESGQGKEPGGQSDGTGQAGEPGQGKEPGGQSDGTGQAGEPGQRKESGGQSDGAGQAGEPGQRKESGGSEEDISGKEGVYIWNSLEQRNLKLPESYDYRKTGRAPKIGNQGSLGTCWAFASLTALESSLLPSNRLTFSVDHMSMHNSFLLGQDEGGEYTMSMAYLLGWQGPVLESEDPYGDGISPDHLKPRVHVQEIQVLPSKDYDAIKQAVYLNGGVQSALYTSMRNYQSESVYYNRDTNSYCYIGSEKPNHDSVIVGWDDNYSRENFNMDPEGDGAFICTNSWGEDFGDQGYFYVSYYDSNIGVNNIVYTGVEPVDNYDFIYQSDLCGWVGQIGYGQDEVWAASAYRAGGGEALSAAGFYATGSDTEYELYVARHMPEAGQDVESALNSRILAVKGKLSNAGYYTVPFKDKIQLDDNEKFAIIMKIKTPGTVHPAAIEYDTGDGIAQVDLTDGESYLSHNGSVWEHVEETQACNVCLKAYTTASFTG